MASSSVLDASAILAFLNDEPGADLVEEAIGRQAAISSVNWAEVMSKVSEVGGSPGDLTIAMTAEGVLGDLLEVVPFEQRDAEITADLRSKTRALGLSLGDRACLALGARRELPVLSSDRVWAQLDGLGIEIRVIR